MPDLPAPHSVPALARFPAEILLAFERYRGSGEPEALGVLIAAAVVDYRPAESGPPPSVADGTRLFEDLSYDSVAVAELVFFFEDLFDLTISNEDIMGVRTVGDLRACLERKLGSRTVR
jgi:3-hydroxyacyl-[acyl-carrier-protein] dehydratase